MLLYDAAYAPGFDPAGATGVLIYSGGDTPNPILSKAALAAYTVGNVDVVVPGWVRSYAGVSAQSDGDSFVNWLHTFGAPAGITTFLDLETLVDPAYVAAFGAVLHTAGYKVMPYGSMSTLFQNPALDGYFVSNPTGAVHLVAGTVATQFGFGGSYDLDDISAVMPLWNIHSPSPVPPAPAPAPAPGQYIVIAGVSAQMAQSRLNVWGAHLVVDGVIGPLTEAAIKAFQTSQHIAVDGIVGPVTWGRLAASPPKPAPAPAPKPAPHPAPAPKPAPHPAPVPPAHRNVFTPLGVDGILGPDTVKAMQFVIFNGNGADCDGNFGPASKKALQAHLGVAQDGIVGPVTVEALQRHVGASADGNWGPLTTEALQRALNAGSF